jgi:hypothetical protein
MVPVRSDVEQSFRVPDIAQTTNADILASVLDVPLLPELTEKIAELPQNGCKFWVLAGERICKLTGRKCKLI